MKCIIQRPASGGESFINAVVEADINRVDQGWGILESLKILNQYSNHALPNEYRDLPVVHKGYCDTHLHAVWMASQISKLSLRSVNSVEEMFAAILKFQTESNAEFVEAFDWDQEKLGVELGSLSAQFENFCQNKNISCVAFRVCGHMALVSNGLCEKWKVPAKTLLKDAELDPVHEILFRWTPEQSMRLFEVAQELFLKKGVTAISEMSVSDGHLEGLRKLAQKGKLKIDVQVVLDHDISEAVRRAGPFVETNASDVGPLGVPAQLQVRHIKRFLDGSIGARTAWLRAAYEDDESFGTSLYTDSDLFQWAEKSLKNGWLLSFHAIGDAALDQLYRMSLYCRDLLKKSLQPEYSPFFKFPARHRIEHAQVMGDDLLRDLLAQQLWSFLVQPYHRVADDGFAIKRLGPTRFYNEAYRLRSITAVSGSAVGLGSDAPIAEWNPIDVLQAAMSHPNPLERVDWLTALWHYTTGARLALGLSPGKLSAGATVVISERSQ